MKTHADFLQLDRFNISPQDVTQMVFHCDPESIHPDVILMPWWQPEVFALWVDPITAVTNQLLYETVYQGRPVSILRTGIGAPQAGDMTLALSCTPCERIFFAGSVGALRPQIHIGDLMIPELAIAGDGFCRYLEPGFPKPDCYLERVAPDEALSRALWQSTARIAGQAGVELHTGPVFSIDTILGQFGILHPIAEELGCVGIEMETAAVFKAARKFGLRAAALFSVSDVPILNKSLYAGRSREEQDHRKQIRRQVLAKAVLECMVSFTE